MLAFAEEVFFFWALSVITLEMFGMGLGFLGRFISYMQDIFERIEQG